jgi:hypothetical protein
MTSPQQAASVPPVVLFDGVCNLCNGAVNFIIDRDPKGELRFAALQSKAAADLLRALGHEAPAPVPDTILFVEDGRVYERSTAVASSVTSPVRGGCSPSWRSSRARCATSSTAWALGTATPGSARHRCVAWRRRSCKRVSSGSIRRR